jgi:8-oxo-dGTP pyrophosphatase MutT (NUDIX family)
MEQKVIAAGLIAICPETGRFLLLKRRDTVKFPGHWGLPAGSFDEKDGYPKITAIREFKEETGYNGPVKISKEPIYVRSDNHINFYFYVGILPNEFTPDLKGEGKNGENESLDYKWVSTTCKWDSDDKIIPSIITVLDLKGELLKKVINKFKDKNYE